MDLASAGWSIRIWPKKPCPSANLGKQEGLSYLQMVRALLEGARTVDEAKKLVSGLKVYFPMDGIHFLISDRNGDSMILEFAEDDLSPRFTEPDIPRAVHHDQPFGP